MKSLRVLLVLAAVSFGLSVASANCGSCEKKDGAAADPAACAAKCGAAEGDHAKCAAGEKKEQCAAQTQAKGDKDHHACCEEAAKAGKACEKCQPAEKK